MTDQVDSDKTKQDSPPPSAGISEEAVDRTRAWTGFMSSSEVMSPSWSQSR